MPTTAQSRALESVQLKASSCTDDFGVSHITGSEAVRGDLDLPLLNSRRDVAKLKWQHRLHALPALSAQLWVFLHDTLNVTHRVLRCWQA